MKRIFSFCAATLLAWCVCQAQPRERRHELGVVTDPMVHDPVMACEGDTYYMYSTGRNLSLTTTKDFKEWVIGRDAFDKAPRWAIDSIRGYRGHTWAPDIIYHDGKYHLFYSCSTFGKNTSAIGHAYRSTLDPEDAEPWTDTGAVVFSHASDDFNAIDPNVVIDDEGQPWMTFGSFWGGIKLVKLTHDLTTTESPTTMYTLCSRRANWSPEGSTKGENAVEAPFIFKHDGYYYLFVSYDFCCRGLQSTYRVVVGRSPQVTGPYVDREGKSLLRGGGTPVVGRSDEFVAIGHSAAYRFGGKDYFMAHGYSRTDGASRLFMREMEWDNEGWPVVKP